MYHSRVTGRMSLVEQDILTPQENPSLPPVFSGVRVTRSLVLCMMFCRLKIDEINIENVGMTFMIL